MSTASTNLEGLRDRLFSEPTPKCNIYGHVYHPALPDTDEDVNLVMLLAAFGIATSLVSMESDAPETAEAYFEAGDPDCSAWNPTPPQGEGWKLIALYDTEDGPYAMFARPDHSIAFPKRAAALAENPAAADGVDAARYRFLRSRMVFTLDGKTREQTMTLASPISAWRHHFGADWMEPRFSASVDRAVDDAIANAALMESQDEGGAA